jgi:hypothetical protein
VLFLKKKVRIFDEEKLELLSVFRSYVCLFILYLMFACALVHFFVNLYFIAFTKMNRKNDGLFGRAPRRGS